MSENKTEAIEAEIVKDNDGKHARNKVKAKRHFNDFWAPILVDLALLTLGVCLLIYADKVTSAISIALGSVFILYAVYNFIKYLRVEQKGNEASSLITAIALIIAGAFLCLNTDFIKEAISFVVGAFIVIISMIKLQDAISFRAYGPAYRAPTLMAFIGLIAGLLCIIGKIIVSDVIMQILGIMLVIFAASNIANAIMLKKLKKN